MDRLKKISKRLFPGWAGRAVILKLTNLFNF